LRLARYGEPEASHRTLPRVSQETLAEMVGTTRPGGELLHEQVSETRVHRIQRWLEGLQLPAERRPARLTRILRRRERRITTPVTIRAAQSARE
jgi:hypothetical protein